MSRRSLRYAIREWESPAPPRHCPPGSRPWPTARRRDKDFIVDALHPPTGVSQDAFDPVSRAAAIAGARAVCRGGFANSGNPASAVAGEACAKGRGAGNYRYFYACTPMSYPLYKSPVAFERAKTQRKVGPRQVADPAAADLSVAYPKSYWTDWELRSRPGGRVIKRK